MNATKVRNLYLKRGSYWFARQVRGKRTWINLQTPDLSEAVKRAAEVSRNPLVISADNLAAEMDRFIAYQLRMNRYSPQSASTKIIALRQFAASVPAAFTSSSVNPEHIKRFYETLQARVTESTAQGYIMSVSSFFRWCVKIERTRIDNPVSRVTLARHDQKGRERFCPRAQKNALIKNAPNDDLRFILFCGFDAGLRRGEIVEARADWFDGVSVHVRKTPTFRPKDRDERSIPMTKPFARFVKRYLKGAQPQDFALQPDVAQGVWRYRYDFRRPFTDYMRAQGVEWITPHVMRHSFASILASAGRSIFKISEWMGDDVEVVQRHYAKLSPGDDDIHALS